MKKSLYLAVILAILVGGGVLISKSDRVNAAGPYPLTGWAWSSNIGWISFNSTNPGSGGGTYSVQADDAGNLTGYAWSSNVGWISFNPSSLSQAPACNGTTAAHINLDTGEVVGWARAIVGVGRSDGWDGCIELTGTNHQKNDPTGNGGVYYDKILGKLKGFAWSDAVIGWLSFMPTLATYVVVPPVTLGVSGSCTASPTGSVPAGTGITFTVSPSGGTSPYTYSWNGAAYGSATQTTIPYYGSNVGPTVIVKDQSGNLSSSISCPNVVVSGTLSTGIRLMIAPTTKSLIETNYDDSIAGDKSLRVVKGNQFKLQRNIDPALSAAGYNRHRETVSPDPITGSFGSWGGVITGQDILNTSGIATGKYTFTLEIYDAAGSLEVKPSSVELNIVSSIEEEI